MGKGKGEDAHRKRGMGDGSKGIRGEGGVGV